MSPWLPLALLLPGAALRAQPADDGWDQPHQFVAAAAARGLPISARASADWAELSPASSLVLLAPEAVEAPEQLRRFVLAGGRLLLAVEGPAAAPALAPFGLRPGPAPAGPLLGGHPALIEIPIPPQARLPGLRRLVTNHPTAVTSDQGLPAALHFADGTPFAWQLRLGEGELRVLGDASLFIDLMRPVADNAPYLDALSDWLAAGGRPITVLTGALRGAPRPPGDPGAKDRLNQQLSRLGRLAAGRPLTIALSVLAALAASLLAWRGFLGARPGPPRPAPKDRRPGPSRRADPPGGPAAPDDRTEP